MKKIFRHILVYIYVFVISLLYIYMKDDLICYGISRVSKCLSNLINISLNDECTLSLPAYFDLFNITLSPSV